jgi:hypothetical protein
MNTGITIILQQDEAGRMTVNHIITGELSLEVAANACRMIANTLDKERIRAEVEAEQEGEDANRD